MLRLIGLVSIATACGAPTHVPPTSPKPPTTPAGPAGSAEAVDVHVRTCSEAAVGLDRATQTLREPDSEVLVSLKDSCATGAWAQPVIDCFATMRADDLAKCASMLPDRARDAMFAVLADREPTRSALAIARARLATMKVGVDECDRFIQAVGSVLTCEAMSLDARVQLGNEAADVWSLPTARLSPEAHARMATTCETSRHSLEKRVQEAGCMP